VGEDARGNSFVSGVTYLRLTRVTVVFVRCRAHFPLLLRVTAISMIPGSCGVAICKPTYNIHNDAYSVGASPEKIYSLRSEITVGNIVQTLY
jgi:hypothetical protein